MRIVAIIQARMGSTRLPGKVMKQVCGKTMLAHLLDRVRSCKQVDTIVVATTESKIDDPIEQEAVRCGVKTFRGSETDVLARTYGAAQMAKADIVIRVTSDCPLFDPQVLSLLIDKFQSRLESLQPWDYFSNTLVRSYPRGLDAEVFTFSALEKAHQQAHQPYEREHVTPYIYQHPALFDFECLISPQNLSHHRWTLDTEEDFQFIKALYEALYVPGQIFSMHDALVFLEQNPALMKINAHVQQKTLTD